MKKILVLALAALLLLPVLPAYAATTEVIAQGYCNIAEGLNIDIKAGEGFTGATVEVDGITHSYNGSGAGYHHILMDVSEINSAGEKTVTVTADYSGVEEVIEKTVVFTKMLKPVKDFVLDTPILSASKLGFRAAGANLSAYPAENPTMWQINGKIEIDLTKLDPLHTGIVDFSYDFRTDEVIPDLRLRMTHNTSNGAAYKNLGPGENGTYYYYVKGNEAVFGANKIPYNVGLTDDDWNHVLIRTDFINNKVYAYLNGVLAECSPIDDTGVEGVADVRYCHFAGPSATGHVDNFKLTSWQPVESWCLNEVDYDGEKIDLEFSEDIGELTSENFKIFNTVNDEPEEISISSITNVGNGVYTIVPSKDFLYGQKYDICLKNGFKSVAGGIAFKEPAEDENGDGYWKLTTVTTPKYALNVDSITDNGTSVDVHFNNTDISDKWCAVCWYDDNGALVDFAILPIVEVYSGEYRTFERNNSTAFSEIKVSIFAFNNDSESADFGALDVIEVYSEN